MTVAGTVAERRPASAEDAAAMLAEATERGERVRVVGAGTKRAWGNAGLEHEVELHTGGLDEVVEHNRGDLTAVLRAGTALARAQAEFAEAEQMLALDPPLGDGAAATVGGVVAAGDSGPLRHRYGSGRDLVVGMTIALADGTISRSGGKVIKNVAGYDLAKLLAGSFGTLGLIVEVAVRLHPMSTNPVTARGRCGSPDELARAAAELAHAHLEAECLDVAWADGSGEVLARFAGAAAADQAALAARALAGLGLESEVIEDDDEAWERQRDGQRSAEGVVVRVAGVLEDVARLAELADGCEAALVGRAALGIYWLQLAPREADGAAEAVGLIRSRLAPRPCVVLDAPVGVRAALDVWDERDPGRLALARRVKERFDPSGTLNAGLFVGGI